MVRRSAFVLSLVTALVGGSALASEWPAFRGAAGDGAIREAVLEGVKSIGMRVAWRRALGSGYSSVSVAGGKAVTMFSDGEEDQLIALDQATGHEHWRLSMGPTYHGHDGSHTGPSSTPLIADGRVYALGPRGRLTAASLESGEVLWSVELAEHLGARKPHYGFSTSPVMAGGTLVVQIGAEEGSAIAGLDPATGEARWTTLDDTIQNQSPVPLPVGESTLVMAAGDKKLVALDPATGELFWEFEHGGAGSRGVLSLMPVPAGDSRVFLAHKDDSSRMIRIGHGADGGVTFESLWENSAIRNSYNVAVYHEGYLYAFSSRFLTCVDAETGETAWKSRAPGDGFVMLVDDRLVIQTKDGTVHVAEASPEGYRELASLRVFDELAWSPPGFADGSLYLRSLGGVARVELIEGKASRVAATDDIDLTGTKFGTFLALVEKVDNKQDVIDAYLKMQKSFPIVEGDDLVHFVYRGEGEDLALAGDMVGSRQEVPMKRVDGTDLFYRSMRLAPDARVSYVFIKDYEETLDPRNPNHEMSTVYGKDMELVFQPDRAIWMSWFAMPGWQAADHFAEVAEERRGTLETHSVASESMENPVNLTVYLPRGYADDAQRRYPVAYVNGGTAAQQAGRMVTALDNLVGQRVEPLIVAFVDAPLPPFQMGKYGSILIDDVVAFVDANYRTRAERASRASIGFGFPAYGAMFAAFTRADAIGRLGAVSPVMLDSMREPLEEILPSAEEAPLDIYLDWGRYDLRNPHENWDMAQILSDFDRLLRERGYSPSGGAVSEGAGWMAHRSRIDDLLEALFPLR